MKAKANIEEQMKEAIVAAGISRYVLAKLSGVSEGVISNFMNGHRSITLETAAKLAVVMALELKPIKGRTAKNKGAVKHGKHID